MSKTPLFEIVQTSLGVTSIRNNKVNETMHNPVGPWKEANALYVDQPEFRKKIHQKDVYTEELVVFDVGLGAAANALVTLHAYKKELKTGPCAPLKIVSFEIDLTLLEFALENAHHFDHFKGYEETLNTLLTQKHWQDPELPISWVLRHGDFLKLMENESSTADLIYYDPYSPKMNYEMWTLNCFEKLKNLSHNSPNRGTCLYTYSRSTPIRSAMFAAGFFVGQGQAIGLKDETTQAATRIEDLSQPLGNRWLQRWQRSDTPYPIDKENFNQEDLKNRILNHPQLKNL